MNDSRLYILMRTDLASMNAGKGMAQAAHAANCLTERFWEHKTALAGNIVTSAPEWFKALADWRYQTTQGFGVTYTLGVPSADAMVQAVLTADSMGYLAEVIHDPTYPVRDGGVTHLIPMDTCAFVFSPSGAPWFLSNFDLHP